MTIDDFYKHCLSLQLKSAVRVYDNEHCIYNGEYVNLPYPIANHDIRALTVNSNMEWKFYF